MEHNDKIKKDRIKNFINVGIILAMIIASVMLLFAIITLVKNKEIIQEDPITYVMSEMGFTSCSCTLGRDNVAKCVCLDADGKDWYSVGNNRFIHKNNYGDFLDMLE